MVLIDALGAALADPDPGVARAAGEALARIGRHCEAVLPVLRRALTSREPRCRIEAAFASARLEPPSLRWLPALVEALADDAADVRWRAARWVVEIGRVHGEVLPLVTGLLASDPAPRVRGMAAHCLRALAPGEPSTAEALLRATRDRDASVRRAALTDLASQGGGDPAVASRLREVASRDSDPASRALADRCLARLGAAQ